MNADQLRRLDTRYHQRKEEAICVGELASYGAWGQLQIANDLLLPRLPLSDARLRRCWVCQNRTSIFNGWRKLFRDEIKYESGEVVVWMRDADSVPFRLSSPETWRTIMKLLDKPGDLGTLGVSRNGAHIASS